MTGADPVIDANCNVGPALYDDFEFAPTLDGLEAALERARIDRGIVAPLAPPDLDYDRANDRLAARLADRDRFTGIARIDPRRAAAVDHAERALSDYGLGGLKLHPWEESFSVTSSGMAEVLQVARERDVPVWVYAGYPHVSHATALLDVAKAHPAVDFVLTHGAQLDISGTSLDDALYLAAETGNTAFELSGVYRRDFIEELVDTVGAERVVFGSNAPYFHPQVERSRVETADLTDVQKNHILCRSANELLGNGSRA